MFVASTILIHGLATVSLARENQIYATRSISIPFVNNVISSKQGLSWGLFSWSVVVGVLSIPELIFVMIMTTQFWVNLPLYLTSDSIDFFH